MVDKIQKTNVELWQVKLESAVGGSGLTAVDVIIADLETKDGLVARGFSYVLGSSGRAAAISARDILDNFISQ